MSAPCTQANVGLFRPTNLRSLYSISLGLNKKPLPFYSRGYQLRLRRDGFGEPHRHLFFIVILFQDEIKVLSEFLKNT